MCILKFKCVSRSVSIAYMFFKYSSMKCKKNNGHHHKMCTGYNGTYNGNCQWVSNWSPSIGGLLKPIDTITKLVTVLVVIMGLIMETVCGSLLVG